MNHINNFRKFSVNEDNSEESKELETLKAEIDKMSHEELARLWRFGKSEDKKLQGEAGEYTRDRLFKHFGGFNPTLSKRIGW